MQGTFIITTLTRASVSRTLAASTPSFAASARSFHISTVRREGESLANIADVVEAGPRSLTAADGEAGKERSEASIKLRARSKIICLIDPVRREP
jgi:hypothetical protein